MAFLAVILSLVVVNLLRLEVSVVVKPFIRQYFSWMSTLTASLKTFPAYGILLIELLPLWLIVLFVQITLRHKFGGLFELLLMIFILSMTLKRLEQLPAALEKKLDDMLMGRFCVILWMVVLGPAMVFLYFLLLCFLEDRTVGKTAARPFVERGVWVIEWLPARLLGLTFAIVGHFSAVVTAFKGIGLEPKAEPRQVLYECARAALSGESVTEAELLKRALLCWLVILAVIMML